MWIASPQDASEYAIPSVRQTVEASGWSTGNENRLQFGPESEPVVETQMFAMAGTPPPAPLVPPEPPAPEPLETSDALAVLEEGPATEDAELAALVETGITPLLSSPHAAGRAKAEVRQTSFRIANVELMDNLPRAGSRRI